LNDRVLVTGATGFIGHHLVHALLEKGDRVGCLVRPTSDTRRLPTEQVSLTIGDVTDPASLQAALEDIDVVYHLAGALTAMSREAFLAVNEAGTRNLAEACARTASSPILIILSSLAAAGPNPDDQPRNEQDPDAPVSKYGRSKLAGERAARESSTRVPLTIVRAPIVFGEWDRDVFKMFWLVKLGVHLIPVRPHQRYSLIHASDVANLLIHAAARGERAVAESAASGLYYAGYHEHLT